MKIDYVIITPAFNEEENIGRLIESMLNQTILPKLWIIANDGSKDKTGEIIDSYLPKGPFIRHLRLERGDVISYYSRKTSVFIKGYESIGQDISYDFVGSLDADVSFKPDYYENLLKEMDQNPKLGLTSGQYVYEQNGQIVKVLIDKTCVPGSLQFFRRECYERIGGYVPLKYGGDDSLATIMAGMHGWQAYSRPEFQVIQHREVGSVGHSILRSRFRQGLTDYGVATHPLFMIFKSIRRAFLEKPYFMGSMARLAGFFSGYLRLEKRQIPDEAKRFVRKEQLKRLFSFCGRK